jgi:hypothetical protein
MNAARRDFGLVITALVVAGSSGCSIVDRMFLLNADGPYAHHARHLEEGAEGGCPPGGPCEDGTCPTGACQDCENGMCQVPHTGRYGGLAKHHLSPAERAAIAGSDYAATQPAGPPTGAVAYPYYTTRGPRDFLAKKPPSIGP